MKFPSTTMEVVLFIIINDRMIRPHENIDDLVMLILIHVDIKQFQIKKEIQLSPHSNGIDHVGDNPQSLK